MQLFAFICNLQLFEIIKFLIYLKRDFSLGKLKENLRGFPKRGSIQSWDRYKVEVSLREDRYKVEILILIN